MTVTAKFCIPALSPSGWVFNWILTCDNELAVTFHSRRHGNVCCLYPGTTKAYFDLAITWPVAGKFVHRFLYRKRAYRLIKSPCPPVGCNIQTNCCGNPIPDPLYATVAGQSGTAQLNYQTGCSPPTWVGSMVLSCGATLYIRIGCSGSNPQALIIQVSWDGQRWASCNLLGGSWSCSPFAVTMTGCMPSSSPPPAGCASSYTVTVTP